MFSPYNQFNQDKLNQYGMGQMNASYMPQEQGGGLASSIGSMFANTGMKSPYGQFNLGKLQNKGLSKGFLDTSNGQGGDNESGFMKGLKKFQEIGLKITGQEGKKAAVDKAINTVKGMF